jgi:hypothetical protein
MAWTFGHVDSCHGHLAMWMAWTFGHVDANCDFAWKSIADASKVRSHCTLEGTCVLDVFLDCAAV